MAPPHMKTTRQGEKKSNMADRVSNKNRVSKAKRSSRPVRRPLQPEPTPSRSKAFDARSSYQAGQDKPKPAMARGSTPSTTQELNNHPNLALRGKKKDGSQVKPDDVLPGQKADSSHSGSFSSVSQRLNMNDMPAEVLELIWGEVINTPACHTFKMKSMEPPEHPKKVTKWAIDLWAKDGSDPSAYLLWKKLLKDIRNIAFQMAFRRFVKHIQPIALTGVTNRFNPCTKMAAIDEAQDLVILETQRGQLLPWIQHINTRSTAVNRELIQERFRHFRRVAIHYKFGRLDWTGGAAFACSCEDAARRHGDYNACPLTLACFLDMFQNLEQFFFVVETKLVWHKKFATEYRGISHISF